jgi:hypothetical protein
MSKGKSLILLAVLSCVWFGALKAGPSYAKSKKLTLEEFVAKHLESLGTPEALAAAKSRTVHGIVSVKRPIGTVPEFLPEPGKRTDPSNFNFASAEGKLSMTMIFYDLIYPGERLVFDGKDTKVSITSSNRYSVLGEFINSFSGMMREGLMGGTLSSAWPLLRVQEGKFKLKYDEVDIDGTKYHQLTYTPKSRRYLDSIIVTLLFDFETFRHVMTEYKQMGIVYPVKMVIEQFGSFRQVNGVTLPHNYFIEYALFKDAHPTRWVVEVKEVSQSGEIDPALFAPK